MKKYYRKVKQFVQDHDDEFFTGTVIVLSTVAAAAILHTIAKFQEQEQERNNWVREQNFAGKAVFVLDDGSYLAVSPEQVS